MTKATLAFPVLFTRTKFQDYSLRLGPWLLNANRRTLALQQALAPSSVAGGPKQHPIVASESGATIGCLILFSESVTPDLLGLPSGKEALDEHGRTLKMTYGLYSSTGIAPLNEGVQAEVRKIAAKRLQSIWHEDGSGFEESHEMPFISTGNILETQEGTPIPVESSTKTPPHFRSDPLPAIDRNTTSRQSRLLGWLRKVCEWIHGS